MISTEASPPSKDNMAAIVPLVSRTKPAFKIAMIRVWETLRRENLVSRLILQIHDELLIEAVPEEEA